ncbi:MAG: DUF4132 domain-containing protein [Burkholderiales bacterium]|nr:MAG: DUF4132 domain-containing protein [Burkholderiales bacterium]
MTQDLHEPSQAAEASLNDLPRLLQNPPWLAKKRQNPLPVLEVATIPTEERLHWTPEELETFKTYKNYRGQSFPDEVPSSSYSVTLVAMRLSLAGMERVKQSQPLQPGDLNESGVDMELVLQVPLGMRLALWNSFPPGAWSSWRISGPAIRKMFADFGLAAIPGLARLFQTQPASGWYNTPKVDSPQLVEPFLHTLRHSKTLKKVAQEWILAHPQTVLFKALPLAFQAKHSQARDNARHGLRWLVANGGEAQAREAAQTYGQGTPDALEALLSADPLQVLPGRMPKLPDFFNVAALHRPVLLTGQPLPVDAVEHIGLMLAISKLDAPYAGLEILRQTCQRASLASFVWDLFEAWLSNGTPASYNWAFTALGLLGDDETARRLTPLVREWPGQSATARAVTGLDMLVAIGSDMALMHLNGIAVKIKYKPLQQKAREKIQELADARGLSTEELADRLIPRLDMDEASALVLDFGTRQFTIAFDETLKPIVKNTECVRLKDLPKPNQSDDEYLATRATDRFKKVKKDAKAIAALQLLRLEAAMVSRRRWRATDFDALFLGHPVMRYLVASLVWGVYDSDQPEGQLQNVFRIAEDWTLADSQDQLYSLPPEVFIGLPHRLEMPADTVAAFGQIFADYEILQPFKQLGRETFALTPEELKTKELTRFANRELNTASVMGLANRGWEGQEHGGGWLGSYRKPIGEQYEVTVELKPGTIMGNPKQEPKQKLPTVTLSERNRYDPHSPISFASLDSILASELLRDLELLAQAK